MPFKIIIFSLPKDPVCPPWFISKPPPLKEPLSFSLSSFCYWINCWYFYFHSFVLSFFLATNYWHSYFSSALWSLVWSIYVSSILYLSQEITSSFYNSLWSCLNYWTASSNWALIFNWPSSAFLYFNLANYSSCCTCWCWSNILYLWLSVLISALSFSLIIYS